MIVDTVPPHDKNLSSYDVSDIVDQVFTYTPQLVSISPSDMQDESKHRGRWSFLHRMRMKN